MIRLLGASLLSMTFLVLWSQAQEDSAPAKKDAKAEEKAKVDDAKKDEVKKDAKDEEEKPAPPAEDPKKIIERLTKNYDDVDTELGDKKNPGESTQKKQRAIIEDLDKLINQQDDNNSNCNCNNGGGGGGAGKQGQGGGQSGGGQQGAGQAGGGGAKNQGGGQQGAKNQGGAGGQQGQKNQGGGGDKKPQNGGGDDKKQQNAGGQGDKKEEKKAGGQGGQGDEKNKNQGTGGAVTDSSKKDNQIADLIKEAWGHLPQKERDKMNAYSRDRLMPKYQDLLRQYYRSIAAQEKRKDLD